MSVNEYASITWKDYTLKCEGFTKARYREWEHTRLLSYTIASANRSEKGRFPSLQEYMPLPTDEGYETKEDVKSRLKKRLEAFKAQHHTPAS